MISRTRESRLTCTRWEEWPIERVARKWGKGMNKQIGEGKSKRSRKVHKSHRVISFNVYAIASDAEWDIKDWNHTHISHIIYSLALLFLAWLTSYIAIVYHPSASEKKKIYDMDRYYSSIHRRDNGTRRQKKGNRAFEETEENVKYVTEQTDRQTEQNRTEQNKNEKKKRKMVAGNDLYCFAFQSITYLFGW